jgi:hypothetical protein
VALAWNIVKLALDSRIRARIIITIHPVFVFEKVKQFVSVDVISAIEIGVDERGFATVSQVIHAFA